MKKKPKAYTPPRRAPPKPSTAIAETRYTDLSTPPSYPPPPRPVPNSAGVNSIAPVTKPVVPATKPTAPPKSAPPPKPTASSATSEVPGTTALKPSPRPKPAVQPRVLGEKNPLPFLPSSFLTRVSYRWEGRDFPPPRQSFFPPPLSSPLLRNLKIMYLNSYNKVSNT